MTIPTRLAEPLAKVRGIEHPLRNDILLSTFSAMSPCMWLFLMWEWRDSNPLRFLCIWFTVRCPSAIWAALPDKMHICHYHTLGFFQLLRLSPYLYVCPYYVIQGIHFKLSPQQLALRQKYTFWFVVYIIKKYPDSAINLFIWRRVLCRSEYFKWALQESNYGPTVFQTVARTSYAKGSKILFVRPVRFELT